jgi:hypothetical protein
MTPLALDALDALDSTASVIGSTGYKSVDDHVNTAGDNHALQSLVGKIDVKHATRVYLP